VSILKAPATSFSPTTDDEVPPNFTGKITLSSSLMILGIIYVKETPTKCHGL